VNRREPCRFVSENPTKISTVTIGRRPACGHKPAAWPGTKVGFTARAQGGFSPHTANYPDRLPVCERDSHNLKS
jgi:hypothetical protein